MLARYVYYFSFFYFGWNKFLHLIVSLFLLSFIIFQQDKNKQLRVGAAIGTRPSDRERVAALYKEGVDVIVLDSSQGNSMYQLDMIKHLKSEYPSIDVIGGNVVTRTQVCF